MKTPRYPLTIYYDASCPLCSEEMLALKACDRAERLRLIDCSAPAFHEEAATAALPPVSELMRQIHACDAAGCWYRGVDVLALAYQAAGIEALARLWVNPRWRPLWDRIYLRVARHRRILSRLHLNSAFGWIVRHAARRARRPKELDACPPRHRSGLKTR